MDLSSHSAAPAKARDWNPSYEWKVVALMALGMGLTGIDRFLIVPMMPVLQKELHLDYQDIGHMTGAFAIAMGVAALFAGNLADRIGFRAVVVPAMIVFSTLTGFSGLAVGLASMVAVRAFMGFAEGAFIPASIV